MTLTSTLNLIHDATRRGAMYSLDGIKWFNRGEAVEIIVKAAMGFAPIKDGNGAYDVTDDIPEIGASVKSERATLVNRVLGEDLPSVVNAYCETVHSTKFIYGVPSDDMKTVKTYTMDKSTFKKFLLRFASFQKYNKCVRLPHNNATVLRWLEMNDRA